MCTSVPSKPPSRESSAERAHHSTTSAMSSGSIAFGVSPYAGDLTADGPQRTRRSSAESLVAFSPKWLSCAKITAPCSCTAAVRRRSDSSASGQVLPGDAREAGRRGRVHDAVAGDQQPGAAPGARGLVVDVALRVDRGLREELHVRRLHDPVADGDVADPERAEEVRIGAHGATLRLPGAKINRMSDFHARERRVRPRHAGRPRVHRRRAGGDRGGAFAAGRRRGDPTALRRAARRSGLAAGRAGCAGTGERHGRRDRAVAALPGRGRVAVAVRARRAVLFVHAGPRPPRVGPRRPVPGRAGRGDLRPRGRRAEARRAARAAGRRLLRALPAARRHPPRDDHVGRDVGLDPPADERHRLHLAAPLRPRDRRPGALPLGLRERRLRRNA